MSRSAPSRASRASRASKGSKASSQKSGGQKSDISRALDFFYPSGSVEVNPTASAAADADEGDGEEAAPAGNASSKDADAPDTREENARMTRAARAYIEFERKWKEK